jgi:serine/arginine repetitive matrix protein 1
LSSADGSSVSTTDAPVTTHARPKPHRAPPRPASPPPRQRQRFRSAQGAFPRRVPARPPRFHAVTSNADPPPIPGLRRPGPASGAPSPPAPEGGGLDPAASGAFFTPGRTWPRAARRLLQPKRSASTTAGLRNPAPNRAARLSPSSPFRAGPRATMLGVPRKRAPLTAREPRIHASGALSRSGTAFRRCCPGLSPRDCSRGELHPDPIGSRTPLVAPPGCNAVGVSALRPERANEPSTLISSTRPRRPLARGCRGGPPPASLREKKMRSAAPEVPSIEGSPLSGGGLFHSLSPTCGVGAPRLFNLRAPRRTDGATVVRRLGLSPRAD